MEALFLLDLLGLYRLRGICVAVGFEFGDDVGFNSLDYIVSAVAVLLWICCVSACASAHLLLLV